MRLIIVFSCVSLAFGACLFGDDNRDGAVPTPTGDEVQRILEAALLTRFDMPPNWYTMLVWDFGGDPLVAGPCEPPPRTSPTPLATVHTGFHQKVGSEDFGPTLMQSIYRFPPRQAERLLGQYRSSGESTCASFDGAVFEVHTSDLDGVGDEGLVLNYTNRQAECGTLTRQVVLLRTGEDLVRIEHDVLCGATDDALIRSLAASVVNRLEEARHGYEQRLTPTPTVPDYNALAFALLTVQDLPSAGWSTGLRGEEAGLGFAFCGDEVPASQLARTGVTFRQFARSSNGNVREELDRLIEAPSVSQELSFLSDEQRVDDYFGRWIESAEACSEYYAKTPAVQETLVRFDVTPRGDRIAAYQQEGYFDSSISVLLQRGNFVLGLEVGARQPDQIDRLFLEEVLRRADEKLADQETELLGEFQPTK